MNRKISATMGFAVVAIGIMTSAVVLLSRNLSVTYECKVDFLYEYEKPSMDVRGRGSFENEEDKLRAGREDVAYGFKRELDLFKSRKGVLMCQRELEPLGESVSRTEAVLSSVRLNVVGMPSTNFVYPCRLVLSDGDRRNLVEYARFCMDRAKERVAEDNWILVAKVAMHEYEQLRKAERRIKELEKHAEDGSGAGSSGAELELAKQTVQKMQKRIEEIRKDVMSRREQRIICESPPEVSWVVRRKERNERQSR